jgi:UTP--glucose-1-phosphate uridylyltransferase
MSSVKKAIIPIAGFGTRFLPVTKALPKSLFPIIDLPIIHYLVEEAIGAGCTEIVIVLNKFQDSVKDYFREHPELEQLLAEQGKEALLKDLNELTNKVKIHFICQDQALGDGHAILCAREIIGQDPCLVLFGDDLVDPPISERLIAIYEETGDPVLALQEVSLAQVSQYGIVLPQKINAELYQIKDLIEKPQPHEAPSTLGIVGKFVCSAKVINQLSLGLKSKDGEIRLVEAFKEYIVNHKVWGYKFPGKRYDIGSKWGLIEATMDFALKRKEIAPDLRQYLSQLAKR